MQKIVEINLSVRHSFKCFVMIECNSRKETEEEEGEGHLHTLINYRLLLFLLQLIFPFSLMIYWNHAFLWNKEWRMEDMKQRRSAVDSFKTTAPLPHKLRFRVQRASKRSLSLSLSPSTMQIIFILMRVVSVWGLLLDVLGHIYIPVHN